MTYDKLLAYVNEFYSDRSRTAEETKNCLEQLQEEISVMIETLE